MSARCMLEICPRYHRGIGISIDPAATRLLRPPAASAAIDLAVRRTMVVVPVVVQVAVPVAVSVAVPCCPRAENLI
jgi:hypothetical protein